RRLGIDEHRAAEAIREKDIELSVQPTEMLARDDVVQIPDEGLSRDAAGDRAEDERFLRVGEDYIDVAQLPGKLPREMQHRRDREQLAAAPAFTINQAQNARRAKDVYRNASLLEPLAKRAVGEKNDFASVPKMRGDVEQAKLRAAELAGLVDETNS